MLSGSSTTNEATDHAANMHAARLSSAHSSPRLKPCSAILFGLALFVFLWGFGYKLSLYQTYRAHEARVPVAKLWIESGSDRALRIPARAYAFTVAHLDGIPIGPLPLCEMGRAALPGAARWFGPVVPALVPARAPPAFVLAGLLQS